MVNVKKATAAGVFYNKEKDVLSQMIDAFSFSAPPYSSRAIIVPHAGFIYSGELAAKGYGYFDKNIKNIFIFAPAHYERIYGCAVCDYDEFETPLGNLQVNQELSKQAAQYCDCNVNNFAFEKEHSIEVQLPFIKKFLPDAKIIPVLYGCENFKNLNDTIKHFWEDKSNGFIISSDLSHFYPEKEACKTDNYTARMIENNDTSDFEVEQACGAVGICGLVDFAKENNFSLIRVGITNSAAVTGDSSRVVGYGSWFLYEGTKNEFIKTFYSDFVIKTCKESIMSGLQLGSFTPENYPCVFEESGACFVTLEINKNLRGCIGTIIAHRPLINDLVKNAHAAAFSDQRFKKLTIAEYERLQISVSLLSNPVRMSITDEDDLLNQLIPNKDGLIIRDGEYQAVFLPSVWEQLPDKKEFLRQLKLKAGMPENYHAETFEAFKFSTVKIN